MTDFQMVMRYFYNSKVGKSKQRRSTVSKSKVNRKDPQPQKKYISILEFQDEVRKDMEIALQKIDDPKLFVVCSLNRCVRDDLVWCKFEILRFNVPGKEGPPAGVAMDWIRENLYLTLGKFSYGGQWMEPPVIREPTNKSVSHRRNYLYHSSYHRAFAFGYDKEFDNVPTPPNFQWSIVLLVRPPVQWPVTKDKKILSAIKRALKDNSWRIGISCRKKCESQLYRPGEEVAIGIWQHCVGVPWNSKNPTAAHQAIRQSRLLPRFRYYFITSYRTNSYMGQFRLLRSDGRMTSCGNIFKIADFQEPQETEVTNVPVSDTNDTN